MFKNEYSLTWKIENFSFCHHTSGNRLSSSYFYPVNFGKLKGQLYLYPRGISKECSNFISCSLSVNTVNSIDFLRCEITAIGGSGNILKVHKWDDFLNQKVDTRLTCPDFLAIEDMAVDAEESEKDTLNICCKLYGRKAHQIVTDWDMLVTKIGVDRHTFKMEIHREGNAVTFGSNRSFKITIIETLENLKTTISALDSTAKIPCPVECILIVSKMHQSLTYSERGRHCFPKMCRSDWEFPTSILSNEWKSYKNYCKKKNIYFDNVIYCEFSYSNGYNTLFYVPKSKSSSFPNKADLSPFSTMTKSIRHLSLQEDLRILFNSKKLSDVKLRADGETIEAHKNVLVARSPVFAVMFDHQDMTETRSGIIDIVDIDAETLKIFLQYLYTDIVDEMNYEIAMSLLMAAEKYQVVSLKEKCSVFLKDALCVEYACEILSLADAVNCNDLTSASFEFIIANSSTILSSPQWVAWMKNNMQLATIIFSKLTHSHS